MSKMFVCDTYNVSFRRDIGKSQSGEPQTGLTDERELRVLCLSFSRFSVFLFFLILFELCLACSSRTHLHYQVAVSPMQKVLSDFAGALRYC